MTQSQNKITEVNMYGYGDMLVMEVDGTYYHVPHGLQTNPAGATFEVDARAICRGDWHPTRPDSDWPVATEPTDWFRLLCTYTYDRGYDCVEITEDFAPWHGEPYLQA